MPHLRDSFIVAKVGIQPIPRHFAETLISAVILSKAKDPVFRNASAKREAAPTKSSSEPSARNHRFHPRYYRAPKPTPRDSTSLPRVLSPAMFPTAHSLSALLVYVAASRLVSFFFHLGLFGLFLVSIVDSSFVPLPLPGVTDVMIVVYAASHTNIILLVAISTIGSALGGLFSHAIGQAGGMAFLEKHVKPALLSRATKWIEKHAILAVAVPAILPPPMPLSPFVLAAGAVHMSRRKFMIAFTSSRFLRHAIAAWLGIRYGKQVLSIWAHFSERWGTLILIVLWSVILLFTAIGIWQLYRTSKSMDLRGNKTRNTPSDQPA